jgi:hypothetical protein
MDDSFWPALYQRHYSRNNVLLIFAYMQGSGAAVLISQQLPRELTVRQGPRWRPQDVSWLAY